MNEQLPKCDPIVQVHVKFLVETFEFDDLRYVFPGKDWYREEYIIDLGHGQQRFMTFELLVQGFEELRRFGSQFD